MSSQKLCTHVDLGQVDGNGNAKSKTVLLPIKQERFEPEEVASPTLISSALTRLLRIVHDGTAWSRSQPRCRYVRGLAVGTAGAKSLIPHGFPGAVYWSVVGWRAAQGSVVGYQVGVGSLGADVTTAAYPTYTDLVTLSTDTGGNNLAGTLFLVIGTISGQTNANSGSYLGRILVDGATVANLYGVSSAAPGGNGVGVAFQQVVSVAAGNHTFKLQGSASTVPAGGWPIKAGSVTEQQAVLTVINLSAPAGNPASAPVLVSDEADATALNLPGTLALRSYVAGTVDIKIEEVP